MKTELSVCFVTMRTYRTSRAHEIDLAFDWKSLNPLSAPGEVGLRCLNWCPRCGILGGWKPKTTLPSGFGGFHLVDLGTSLQ